MSPSQPGKQPATRQPGRESDHACAMWNEKDPIVDGLLRGRCARSAVGVAMIKDVWISYQTGVRGRIDDENREVFGQLTTGYGNQGGRNYELPGEKIGPELAFGITLQKGLQQPVLLIIIGQALAEALLANPVKQKGAVISP